MEDNKAGEKNVTKLGPILLLVAVLVWTVMSQRGMALRHCAKFGGDGGHISFFVHALINSLSFGIYGVILNVKFWDNNFTIIQK